jgi:deoxynucleoside triphosphate triphosphohydrolase SAMHD1
MVVDTFLAADPILDISSRIYDPERYLYLTDSILEEIERSIDPRLASAREIILRMRRRDLYRCVDYLHVGVADKAALAEVVTAQEVAREANTIRLGIEDGEGGGGVREVKESDVIINWGYLHFGMKERDPMEQVLFYGKGSANSESF